jgi:RNA polymerase sigma-B factor
MWDMWFSNESPALVRLADHIVFVVGGPCMLKEADEAVSGRAQRAARDAALFQRLRRDRDRAARDELVERYTPLARHLARRYRGQAESEDLEQVALLALVKAIDRFDPERGIAFTSFAVPTVLGEIKRYFRDLGWVVRVPRSVQELKQRLDREVGQMTATLGRSPTPIELADRTETTVEQVMEALAAASAHYPESLDRPANEDGDPLMDRLGGDEDPGFARAEDAVFLDSLLDRLDERQRAILRLRFEHDLTQAEIGRRLGISQMHVSRLARQAIGTLQANA